MKNSVVSIDDTAKDGPFDYGDRDYLQAGIDVMHELMKNRCTQSHRTNPMPVRWHVDWWMMHYRLGAIIDPAPIVNEEASVTGWYRSDA
jgi:hypothetical protein